MFGIHSRLNSFMISISLKKKLVLLFVFCVLVPLIVIDGVVFYNIIKVNRYKKEQELRSDAEAVRYGLINTFDYPSRIIQNVYKNEEIEVLLNKEYYDPLDYYNAYTEFKRDSLYESWLGIGNETLEIYADNDTILNGGMFYKLSEIRNEAWYRKVNEKSGTVLMFDFGKDQTDTYSRRKIYLMRRMDMARSRRMEKILKMTINYRNLQYTVLNDSIGSDVYICLGDKLLMSNVGGTHYREPYQFVDKSIKYDLKSEMTLYGEVYTIYLNNKNDSIWMLDFRSTIVVIILLAFSIILPLIMIQQLDESVAQRIGLLDKTFERAKTERLTKISDISGNDEISSLMKNYNVMADRMNDLIQTAYIDKLKQQEMDIARQKAELLALHSQINPHFLFNALESIRMHSLIKNEKETAEMVEHLAIMQRVNVDWHSDIVSVEGEMKFIDSYLKLQKYRFGERLSYSFDVEPECYDTMIPKLSLVTFVENACVHGIESKTEPGWIFVRIYSTEDDIIFEIEDTGIGMDEEMKENLLFKMNNASLELIKTGTGIGMTNACLRIKMMTDKKARFDLETEVGVGTTVFIAVPKKKGSVRSA